MPLTCAFCKTDIQPGELVQPDVEMNLAHKTCVDTELKKISQVPEVVHVPSVAVSPLPPAPPSPLPKAILEGAFPAPDPVPCSECGNPAIGMCPHCKLHVCQDYGYNGHNCSGRHEGKCEGARKSRDPNPKPATSSTGIMKQVEVGVDVAAKAIDGVRKEIRRNGVHKSSAKSKKGRR